MKTKRIVITLAVCAVCAVIVSLLPLRADAAVYGRVIRLHVLANSDSPADQALKLTVRDALLEVTADLLADCKTANEASGRLGESLDLLKQCADDALIKAGSDRRARVSLGTEAYPTRSYAGFRLPRGSYTSLKVEIGDGAGQNWWCVLFPSLCLSASKADTEDAFISAGFTPDQVRVLTETEDKGYVIRFRILEWLGGIFS